MVNRTITTYTLINYFSEKGIRQIDLYVPFACKSINNRAAKSVNAEDLQKWFAEDYGLSKVYQGVFVTLLIRLKTLNILNQEKGVYYVIQERLIKKIEEYHGDDHSADINILCDRVIAFAKVSYGVVFSNDEAQNGILRFLNNHDGDIIFDEDNLIDRIKNQEPNKRNLKKINFILSKYIIWSKEKEPQSFQLLKNIAKGHALSVVISMKGLNNYVGKMVGVIVALDTPVIFNLLDLNENANLEMANELLGILQKQGCTFVIFRQHYQEVLQTINSTIYLLRTKNYSLEKASRLLKYCVRNRKRPDELQVKLETLQSTLDKWKIKIEDAPGLPQRYTEIDCEKLESLLVQKYQDNKVEIDGNKRKTIENDVDVVSYIYRLRGNNPATNLKNCKAFLVTCNTSLAYVSKHPDLSVVFHSIPVCMTDVFLSTILWFQYPDIANDINEKLLLSECYNNLTLSDEILHRFYKEVKEINEHTPISEELMLNISTSRVVQELLVSKTYNDSSLYTGKTTAEILQEIEIENNKNLNATREELQGVAAKLSGYDSKLKKIADVGAKGVVLVLWMALMGLFLYLKFGNLSSSNCVVQVVIAVLLGFQTLWGLLSWMGLIWTKANILNCVSNEFYQILKKWFDK